MEVGAEIPPVVVKLVVERKMRTAAVVARNGLAYQMYYIFEWETSIQLLHPAAVDVVVPPTRTKRESSIEDSYSHQTKTRHY